MVDIHSHVLYGLDDGATGFETSVSMLRLAADSGTTDIVATPHADLTFLFQPEEIGRQLRELSAVPGLPVVHRGCDFHLSFDNIDDCLRSPAKYTVNGLRYLLVEFSDWSIPTTIDDIFRSLRSRGITPIITHPERNPILSRNPRQLAEWVRSGCRIQITAQSLTGRFGRHAECAACSFLKQRLVHFVASDAHNLKDRPPDLRGAFERVARECGPETAAVLFTSNPAAVLTGADVSATMGGMTKTRGWFKLW